MPKTKTPSPESQIASVIERTKSTGIPIRRIAEEAGVEESWLKMFRRGKIKNPGVIPFQRLVSYLERTP